MHSPSLDRHITKRHPPRLSRVQDELDVARQDYAVVQRDRPMHWRHMAWSNVDVPQNRSSVDNKTRWLRFVFAVILYILVAIQVCREATGGVPEAKHGLLADPASSEGRGRGGLLLAVGDLSIGEVTSDEGRVMRRDSRDEL